MNLKKISPWIVVMVFILVVISSFSFIKNKNQSALETSYIKIAGQTIKVELSVTQEEQKQGLSGRKGLKDDEGILFVFRKPAVYYFWMKDMNFPIDIIWIGEDLRVIYIKKDARPDSYPETFRSDKNAKYVLEVISGFSEKNNLKEGDSVVFLQQ